MRFVAAALVTLVSAAGWPATAQTGSADPAAAAERYRVARRLAAEGSPEAFAALQTVLDLDPRGPLADDALVEQASLLPLARWPEQLGALEIEDASRARALLGRVIEELPRADRADQARYLRGLVALEPLPGRDASSAKVDFTTVATARHRSAWAAPAGHALAWTYEQQGRFDRARDAYQRLIVDEPDSEAARRARVGLARQLLRGGEPGQAARWLQEAVEGGAAGGIHAELWRELALRQLFERNGVRRAARPPQRTPTGLRTPSGLSCMPAGGVLIADRKQGRLVELSRDGARVNSWQVEALQAATVGANGLRYAAAGEAVMRLGPDGLVTPIATLADYAPVSQLAADGTGGLWLLGRKGKRVGRIDPGAVRPRALWTSDGPKLSSIAWDGRQVVGADIRSGNLLAIDRSGTARPLVADDQLKPSTVVTGPAGRLAMLDRRGSAVWFVGGNGLTQRRVDLAAAGVTRALAVAFGPDGALSLLDGADASWVRLP